MQDASGVEDDQWIAAIGGDIRAIPGFNHIWRGTKRHRCVALCDEDGIHKQLPGNHTATYIWHTQYHSTTLLLGTVIVLYGDAEFMDAL